MSCHITKMSSNPNVSDKTRREQNVGVVTPPPENQIKIEEIAGYKALTELLPQTRNLFHLFGDPPS